MSYIKYIRFVNIYTKYEMDTNLQKFFDYLVSEGWEIISYKEKKHKVQGTLAEYIKVIMVCGKRNKEA